MSVRTEIDQELAGRIAASERVDMPEGEREIVRASLVRTARRAGHTWGQIASMCGVSPSTARRWLRPGV